VYKYFNQPRSYVREILFGNRENIEKFIRLIQGIILILILFYGGDPLFAHPPVVLGQRLGD
jgi:hypothetical protein